MSSDPARQRAPLAGLLLLAATILHVAAVIFPFVEMRALLSTSTYGLIPSVRMLIDYGMVTLAVLVVVFSIIFPFAKLLVLWRAWGVATPGPLLGRLVHLAEHLGRWSMLDVFLVLLLLAVTAGQTLVATKPLIGMPCFLGGVLCSMTAGVLLSRRWPARVAPRMQATWRTWILIVVAGLCLLAAQVVPVLATDSMLVEDRELSLFAIALAMYHNQSWALAAAVGGGLIILPWLTWLTFIVAIATGRPVGLGLAFARWSMIDVFGLALGIFLIESANAVPALMGPGAVALCLGVVVRLVALRLCREQPVPEPAGA